MLLGYGAVEVAFEVVLAGQGDAARQDLKVAFEVVLAGRRLLSGASGHPAGDDAVDHRDVGGSHV